MSEDCEEICTYTRKDALEAGLLVDVSSVAVQTGFPWPVALTADAWQDCVLLHGSANGTGEQNSERLLAVLFALMHAIQNGNKDCSEIPFGFIGLRHSPTSEPVTLRAIVCPDDEGNPCINIVMPIED